MSFWERVHWLHQTAERIHGSFLKKQGTLAVKALDQSLLTV